MACNCGLGRRGIAARRYGWLTPQQSSEYTLIASYNSLAPLRLWWLQSTNSLEHLGDLTFTEDDTQHLGPIPQLGLWNGRQRHHAKAAQTYDDALAALVAAIAARPTRSQPPTAVEVSQAADIGIKAARAANELRVNAINVERTASRLERMLGPVDGGWWVLAEDESQRRVREATVDGIAGRAQLEAERIRINHESADRANQQRSTRSNTLATLLLAVVAGTAGFAALVTPGWLQLAVGVVTGDRTGVFGVQRDLPQRAVAHGRMDDAHRCGGSAFRRAHRA